MAALKAKAIVSKVRPFKRKRGLFASDVYPSSDIFTRNTSY